MTVTIQILANTAAAAAAAAAESLQSCTTLGDPRDGSPPGSPSLGFSRQEHWSGLPFPSPMQKSEKWKWSRSVVSDSLWPHGLQPTRLLHPWDFPGRSTGVGCHCLLLANTITILIQENATWKHSPYQSHPQTGKLGDWVQPPDPDRFKSTGSHWATRK